jgi:radical SAM protein with 4Fe4S-binding SPASM domain
MLKTVVDLGAVTWDVFMLVPTGRGKIEDEVTSQEYEEVLNWIYGVSRTAPIRIKVTCAPHYMRIVRQKAKERRDSEKDSHRLISQSMRFGFQTGWTGPMSSIDNCFEAHPSCCSESDKFERVIPSDDQESTLKSFFGSLKSISSEREDHRNADAPVHQSFRRGCLAGTGFCFVSHVGDVQPCGYLNLVAGNIRKQSFGEIYLESELFRNLRDVSQLGGKCGYCEYRMICGGCRARAYGVQGDYLGEEPYCIYQPRKREKNSRM